MVNLGRSSRQFVLKRAAWERRDFPVSRSPTVNFGKLHSGTDFGKPGNTDDRQHDQRGRFLATGSQSGRGCNLSRRFWERGKLRNIRWIVLHDDCGVEVRCELLQAIHRRQAIGPFYVPGRHRGQGPLRFQMGNVFDPATMAVVGAADPARAGAHASAREKLYPLHAAKVGGLAWKVAITLSGLALAMLGSLAVYGFWKTRSNMRASARRKRLARVSG
jgi:hypothetical protein